VNVGFVNRPMTLLPSLQFRQLWA